MTVSVNKEFLTRWFLIICISFIFYGYLTFSKCGDDLDCGSNIKYKLCKHDTCTPCEHTSQCSLNHGDHCQASSGHCLMMSLFGSFDLGLVLNTLVIFIGAFIAAGGGLGGGGIFVPCFIIFLRFDIQSSAALSQATIFGGSIVNIIMNIKLRHPTRPHRPLTDFNTILVLEPMLLGGTVIGVLLNEIMPDPIILSVLMVVLIIAVYRMVKKGIHQWQLENAQMAEHKDALLNGQGGNAPRDSKKNNPAAGLSFLAAKTKSAYEKDISAERQNSLSSAFAQHSSGNLRHSSSSQNNQVVINDGIAENASEISATWVFELADKIGTDAYSIQTRLTPSELQELCNLVKLEERIAYPLVWMTIVWLIVSVFALLRSSDYIVNVSKCSIGWFSCLIGIYPCLLGITLYISRQNMKQYTRKIALFWIPAEGDITWTMNKAIVYPFMAAAAGFLGGFLGIGGGMIVSPMLLELGVLPRVASATSALAVLMTSSSSTFQKVLLNMLRYDFMAFYMTLGVIGTFIGQTVVNVAIRKYGRNSIVVFAVSSVIGIAIVLMGVNSATSMTWSMTPQSMCD